MIIIPAIDIVSGECIRLEQGKAERKTVYPDSPLEMGKKWEKEGARLIHVVDIEGAFQGKLPHIHVVFDGALQGVNSFGYLGWEGPDDGNSDQAMVFRLYAVDIRLDLPPAASREDVEAAMNGHILEQTELIGLC